MNVNMACSNPIRPEQNEWLMAPMLRNSEGGVAEGKDGDKIDNGDGKEDNRADVEDEARRPKAASRPYTPTK